MSDSQQTQPVTQSADESVMDDWAAAMAEQADASAPTPVEMPELVASAPMATTGYNGEVNLDVILDVPVTVSMEIGRTRLSIRNLLQLNQGSVVELDRLAGEPMDVLVNGTLIAQGEVVVVNEKFGIRLTDVISPADRIRKLK